MEPLRPRRPSLTEDMPYAPITHDFLTQHLPDQPLHVPDDVFPWEGPEVADNYGFSPPVDEEHENQIHENPAFKAAVTPLHIFIEELEVDTDDLPDFPGDLSLKDMINIPSPTDRMRTPLHLAAQHKFTRVAKGLTNAGADLDVYDSFHMQPIHIACETGNTDLLEILLEHEALCSGCDLDGWTPLHFASWKQPEPEMARLLLKHDRTSLNKQDSHDDWTPLLAAVYTGSAKVVDVLLDEGADVCVRDRDSWTPLVSAFKQNHFDILESLIDHLAKPESDDAARHAINLPDDEGMTILMSLCTASEFPQKTVTCIEKLLKLRPNPEVVDYSDRTILDHAVLQATTSETPESQKVALQIISWVPKTCLLQRNRSDKTAFDDVFGKEHLRPLWDGMLHRLKTDDKDAGRLDLLCWLAKTDERHQTALDILVAMGDREKIPEFLHRDDWKLVHWAIYHRLPPVLLSCPPLSSQDDKNRGRRMIEQLRKADLSKEREARAKDESKGSGKDGHRPRTVKTVAETQHRMLDAMEDILDYIYVEKTQRTKASLKVSVPSPDDTRLIKSLQDFYAAVVEIRQDDNEFSRASKFRKVEDIIYGHSRLRTIRNTAKEFQNVTMRLSRKGRESGDDGTESSSFTWVHFPATNMVWMMDTMKKILNPSQSDEYSEEDDRMSSFFKGSWAQIPDETSSSRFMRPRYVPFNVPTNDANSENGLGLAGGSDGDGRSTSASIQKNLASALYMPFLVTDYNQAGLNAIAADNTSRITDSGIAAPSLAVAAALTASNQTDNWAEPSERQNLFRAYQNSVIHKSPTLDEHYYHFATDDESEKDRRDRNNSQVFTKYLTEYQHRDGVDKARPCRILRVSQLWAWTIGDEWLITATSCAKAEKESTFVKDILSHLRTRVEDGSHGRVQQSPAELSKVIVEYCIGTYGRQQKVDIANTTQQEPPSAIRQGVSEVEVDRKMSNGVNARPHERSIRQVFSDSINTIGRQEAELFGRFSAPGNNSEGQGTKSHWGAHGTASVQDATRDAAKLVFEIKDVRDELNILKTIAEYQGKVQSLMDDNGPSDTDDGFDEDLTAKYVMKDIKELDGLAKKTEDALHTTITLYESEIANLQAKEAADQGKRVMVFTVVTVWFLPLSFLSSLFALDVESFLTAPWWSLIVIFVVPLPFLLVATGYMHGRDPNDLLPSSAKLPGLQRFPFIPREKFGRQGHRQGPYWRFGRGVREQNRGNGVVPV